MASPHVGALVLRWCALSAVAGGAGLVLVVLCAYLVALRRVRTAGLSWLGLKIAHVALLAFSYEVGATYIWAGVYWHYAHHGAAGWRAVAALVYGAAGIAGQLAIIAYERRGGSVGAYALHSREGA